MTVKEKQGFGLYFLFAFGMAWLCQVGGCIALLQQNNAVLYQLALIVTMFCPLLAVLLVQKAFLRQPTGIGWKVQGKRRFWLAAWFGPAVLTLLGAVLYFAVFPSRLDFSGSWLVTAYGGEMDAQTLRSQLGVSTLSYLLQNGLFAVLLAPAINMFPALGEEVGWRGYMMPHLKERFGLLNGRLLGGVVWGVWHWPLMLLVGYEYGTNYLGAHREGHHAAHTAPFLCCASAGKRRGYPCDPGNARPCGYQLHAGLFAARQKAAQGRVPEIASACLISSRFNNIGSEAFQKFFGTPLYFL